ncbi:hypothetical protein MOX02_54360 [Methylobacterium oxalidis]|uniref:Uncharacterized protein n=1 Tax=Methylobacterium oxalidis TaxID=944322 RepID=A0A512JBQ3_9HYPH|nr:hypothetical protein MOX02_54360 [Methylobacterium oxalidis]GLS67656.1 hypothetical protein GCM10007888_60410 [Methylobacterium oxalidis]
MLREALKAFPRPNFLAEPRKPAQAWLGETTSIRERGEREANQKLGFFVRYGPAAQGAGRSAHRRHGLAKCWIALQFLKA